MSWSTGIIPREQIEAFWPLAYPLLEPAVARAGGRISEATVYAGLMQGTHLLWATTDGPDIAAVATTRVAQYPLKKMLVVECLGGAKLDEWVSEMNDTLTRFAKASGLSGIEMFGRSGWARALQPYGWKPSMVVCEMNFDEEPFDV